MEAIFMPTNNIIFSGFGGQGIVAAGKTIIHAGMLDGKHVSMLPSYGPEMRGGFANCHVIISDTVIASPIISMADIVIAMSLPALEKFEASVKPGKTLIVDSHLINRDNYRKDINVIEIPATRMAIDAGNVRFANVIMIGAMMSVLGTPSLENMTVAVKDMLPKEKASLFDLEMKALCLGIDSVKSELKSSYSLSE
jgi:2-oxoglutarate ferredoxin oxidoreductase subunit gamma